MKALYSADGFNEKVKVTVLSWDRDKYFTFLTSSGEVGIDKFWKFDVKRSNKLYKLPDYVDEPVKTNKEAALEIKKTRKKRSDYCITICDRVVHVQTLKKCLAVCKSNPTAIFASVNRTKKTSWTSAPLLEKDGGFWYYFKLSSFVDVSDKTLNKFCIDMEKQQ